MIQPQRPRTRAQTYLRVLAAVLAFAGVPLPSSADHDVDLQATGNKIPDPPKSITLKIDTVPNVGIPSGYPVTTGVPFADGQLSEAGLQRLRLLGPGGEPVPAQFDVRGRYLRSKDVRWLGVDLQLEPAVGEYRLEMAGGHGPSHPTPVRVESTGDAFVVTAGELKAEVPKVGAMLRRVWLAGDLVIERGPADGNWLTTLDGQLHHEEAEKAEIELNGPLHTTIRVHGRYVDPEGRPSCKWTARLHFFAGLPAIRIDHRLTWIGKAEALKIRDLAVSFGLKRPATEAAADDSDAPTGEPVVRPLAQGQMLALLQDEHWHWGHGNSHFGIYHGPLDKPKEIATGQRAGSWVGVSDGQRSVTLAMRDFWQQFPKELRAEPNRLAAYLWATHGGALPPDLTFDNLEKFWGEPMLDQLKGPDAALYQRQRQRGDRVADPTGVAKSHDLLLVFGDDGSAVSADTRLAEIFDSPPLVRPDPKWTTRWSSA
ncbi:MAG: exo-rhamnogalacturonan lyase family protein [Planctomycetota bacterium]